MSDEKPERIPSIATDDNRSLDLPTATGLIEGAASLLSVPGLSDSTQQLIRQIVGEPLERRHQMWLASLGAGILLLQERLDTFNPANLAEDEEFVSVVAETTRIAMTTHRTEKLVALRNIVLNAAAGVRMDEVLHATFLGYVDRFSALHLRVLKLLVDPTKHPAMVERAGEVFGSLDRVLLAAWPEIGEDDSLLIKVVRDLEQEGLTDSVAPRAMTSPEGVLAKRTTPLGDAFLRFISEDPARVRP